MGTGIASVVVLVLIIGALALGMRWYLERARSISSSNSIRKDFQRDLLLSLQDIREDAEGELAAAIDELIEIARYSTPASNTRTSELDEGLSVELESLCGRPTVAGAQKVKRMLINRNRRARL